MTNKQLAEVVENARRNATGANNTAQHLRQRLDAIESDQATLNRTVEHLLARVRELEKQLEERDE